MAWVFGWPETMPALVIEGESLTFLKHAGEGVLVGLFLAAALLLVRRAAAATPPPFDVPSLLCAAALMAIGEAVLTLFTRLSDLALVVGHVYKVAGFWLVYRTIVADSIRSPYQRLLDSRSRLRHSEEELRTITDNIPAMVAFVDNEQRYQFVNRNYQRWLGLTPEKMIGRTALRDLRRGALRHAAAAPRARARRADLRGRPPRDRLRHWRAAAGTTSCTCRRCAPTAASAASTS